MEESKRLDAYETPTITIIEFLIEENITVSGNGSLYDEWLLD